MIDIMLTGIGGQGTVLAAKVLAQAAQAKGWKVRTAETIGMAQRGGSVISHVRIGDKSEAVHAPLLSKNSANLIIAFEPAEAVRVLPYLASDGILVSASTGVQPVSAALSNEPYSTKTFIDYARGLLGERFILVDENALLGQGNNRKSLNMVLLAIALDSSNLSISVSDLKEAIHVCVKPQFIQMNLQAVDAAISAKYNLSAARK